MSLSVDMPTLSRSLSVVQGAAAFILRSLHHSGRVYSADNVAHTLKVERHLVLESYHCYMTPKH